MTAPQTMHSRCTSTFTTLLGTLESSPHLLTWQLNVHTILELVQCSMHLLPANHVCAATATSVTCICQPLIVLVPHTHTALEAVAVHTTIGVPQQRLGLDDTPAADSRGEVRCSRP